MRIKAVVTLPDGTTKDWVIPIKSGETVADVALKVSKRLAKHTHTDPLQLTMHTALGWLDEDDEAEDVLENNETIHCIPVDSGTETDEPGSCPSLSDTRDDPPCGLDESLPVAATTNVTATIQPASLKAAEEAAAAVAAAHLKAAEEVALARHHAPRQKPPPVYQLTDSERNWIRLGPFGENAVFTIRFMNVAAGTTAQVVECGLDTTVLALRAAAGGDWQNVQLFVKRHAVDAVARVLADYEMLQDFIADADVDYDKRIVKVNVLDEIEEDEEDCIADIPLVVERGCAPPTPAPAAAPKALLDQVVIDGANVALGYDPSISVFRWQAIEKVTRYFAKRGLRPVIVMQAAAWNQNHAAMPLWLTEFIHRAAEQDGMPDCDDMITLSLAKELECHFVSNDQYRDFQVGRGGTELAAWYAETGQKRHVGYSFDATSRGSEFTPHGFAFGDEEHELEIEYRTQQHLAVRRDGFATVQQPVFDCLTLQELARVICRTEAWQSEATLYSPAFDSYRAAHAEPRCTVPRATLSPVLGGYPLCCKEASETTSLHEWGIDGRVVTLYVVLHRLNVWAVDHGPKSYQHNFIPLEMLSQPTQRGQSCFCATLYSVVSNVNAQTYEGALDGMDSDPGSDVTWEPLLAAVRATSQFAPLVYALSRLSARRYLPMSERVALFEGLCSLFRTIAHTAVKARVADAKLFEFAPQLWAALFQLAADEDVITEEMVQQEATTTVSLLCARTQHRLTDPVTLRDDESHAVYNKILGADDQSKHVAMSRTILAFPADADDAQIHTPDSSQLSLPCISALLLGQTWSNLEQFAKATYCLKTHPTLTLKNRVRHCVTPIPGPQGMAGMFTPASESASDGQLGKVAIFEPNKSMVVYHDPDKLARTIAEMMVDDEFEAALRDVEVEEAVMVLLDVSRSMDEMNTKRFSGEEEDKDVDGDTKRVCIKNVPKWQHDEVEKGEQSLITHLQAYGKLESMFVLRAKETGATKGIAFATFESVEAAAQAIKGAAQARFVCPFRGQRAQLLLSPAEEREKGKGKGKGGKGKGGKGKGKGGKRGGQAQRTRMTRLEAMQACFHAYANRAEALDLPCAIGLCCFGSSVQVTCPLTELFETFKEHVDASNAQEQLTRLYDAVAVAADALVGFRQQHPQARLRVLCLTDGADHGSEQTHYDVTAMLRRESILLDAVIIGNEPGWKFLSSMTEATGGRYSRPQDLSQVLNLFENEAMLSLSSRVMTKPLLNETFSKEQLKKLNGRKRQPTVEEAPLLQPALRLPQNTTSVEQSLLQSAKHGPPADLPHQAVRRIMKELQYLSKHPVPGVDIVVAESDDVTMWKVLLEGPVSTPYADGCFEIRVRFSADYPRRPPELRFATPILHCNISNPGGRVCHQLLERLSWTVDTSMTDLLNAVTGLLITPEPDHPLNTELAECYHMDKNSYFTRARDHCCKHAQKSLAQFREECTTIGAAPPDWICPLSGKLFIDPVIAPSQIVYERENILEHLRSVGEFDPELERLAGQDLGSGELQLREQDLVDHDEMKDQCQGWQQANSISELDLWWDQPAELRSRHARSNPVDLVVQTAGFQGGFLFLCDDKTELECLDLGLCGLPAKEAKTVLGIQKGKMLLFLYNTKSRCLLGVFESASDGNLKIVPEAWAGRYPAQVKMKAISKFSVLPAESVNQVLGRKKAGPIKPDQLKMILEAFESLRRQEQTDLRKQVKQATAPPSSFGFNMRCDVYSPYGEPLTCRESGRPLALGDWWHEERSSNADPRLRNLCDNEFRALNLDACDFVEVDKYSVLTPEQQRLHVVKSDSMRSGVLHIDVLCLPIYWDATTTARELLERAAVVHDEEIDTIVTQNCVLKYGQCLASVCPPEPIFVPHFFGLKLREEPDKICWKPKHNESESKLTSASAAASRLSDDDADSDFVVLVASHGGSASQAAANNTSTEAPAPGVVRLNLNSDDKLTVASLEHLLQMRGLHFSHLVSPCAVSSSVALSKRDVAKLTGRSIVRVFHRTKDATDIDAGAVSAMMVLTEASNDVSTQPVDLVIVSSIDGIDCERTLCVSPNAPVSDVHQFVCRTQASQHVVLSSFKARDDAVLSGWLRDEPVISDPWQQTALSVDCALNLARQTDGICGSVYSVYIHTLGPSMFGAPLVWPKDEAQARQTEHTWNWTTILTLAGIQNTNFFSKYHNPELLHDELTASGLSDHEADLVDTFCAMNEYHLQELLQSREDARRELQKGRLSKTKKKGLTRQMSSSLENLDQLVTDFFQVSSERFHVAWTGKMQAHGVPEYRMVVSGDRSQPWNRCLGEYRKVRRSDASTVEHLWSKLGRVSDACFAWHTETLFCGSDQYSARFNIVEPENEQASFGVRATCLDLSDATMMRGDDSDSDAEEMCVEVYFNNEWIPSTFSIDLRYGPIPFPRVS